MRSLWLVLNGEMYQRCLKVKAVWLTDAFLFHEGQQVVWFKCWYKNIWSYRERAVKYSRRRHFVKLFSSQRTNWRKTLQTSERILSCCQWDLCTDVKWWFILISRTRWRTWLWWITVGSLCWFGSCWSADTCWHHRGSHQFYHVIRWLVFQKDRRLGLNQYLPGYVAMVTVIMMWMCSVSAEHGRVETLRFFTFSFSWMMSLRGANVPGLAFKPLARSSETSSLGVDKPPGDCRGETVSPVTPPSLHLLTRRAVNLPCEGDITTVLQKEQQPGSFLVGVSLRFWWFHWGVACRAEQTCACICWCGT